MTEDDRKKIKRCIRLLSGGRSSVEKDKALELLRAMVKPKAKDKPEGGEPAA